jgi:NAD-dependent SIR2 family protein deacetylase
MSVLDKIYTDKGLNPDSSSKTITWCEKDKHNLFEFFNDFNEWIDGDDGLDLRIKYNIDGLSSPSKAFFASDIEAYNQAFKAFRIERKKLVLGEEFILNKFGDSHWFDRNLERFEQLEKCLIDRSLVPFVGAGLSVECGFPSWKQHLLQQGRTSGIDATHVNALLDNGQYEEVIEEIENKGYRDAFIQEIKDVFSKTGKITETTLRLSELFTDTIITTNYDHIIEQAFDTGEENNIQLIESSNILEIPDLFKTTIIKLHGDINKPAKCILGKNQYNEAYGNGTLDLSKPIPKLLSYHYRTSNLLFLGCSLNQDRTMQVFQAVKDYLGDIDRPPHFSLESMPENEDDLTKRNAYLLKFGITPIWFPNSNYDYIEQILRLARNEMRYRGFVPGEKREYTEPVVIKRKSGILSSFKKVFQSVIN